MLLQWLYLHHGSTLAVLSGSSVIFYLLCIDTDATFYDKFLESSLASMLIAVGKILFVKIPHLSDDFLNAFNSLVSLNITIPIRQQSHHNEYFKHSYTFN